jgi:hypothetical protein
VGRRSDVFKFADVDAWAQAMPSPHFKLEQTTAHQMKGDLRIDFGVRRRSPEPFASTM